uniref:SanA/YdcF family protein n=1 Tax=Thaumasiovibrio occultus TaxID=1891184 RepID=UPI00192CF723|nr:YdcF family protein [Thaumasiovibrio occultus]
MASKLLRWLQVFRGLRLLRWFGWSLAGAMLVGIVAVGALYYDGADSWYSSCALPPRNAVAVVLGNKVERDGTPSPRLAARLDAALGIWQAGYLQSIIVSGGTGKEGFDEAAVMARYLMDNGVPQAAINIDSHGVNTRATADYVAATIAADTPVIAVSQQFHVSRSKLALRQAGFQRVYGHPADFVEWRDIYSSSREVAAWVKYWFTG